MTWLKNGDVIMSGTTKDKPHVMVDVFNTLHLTTVTQAERGNYTCFVGNTHMLDVTLNVVPQTELRTEGKRLYLQSLGIYSVA